MSGTAILVLILLMGLTTVITRAVPFMFYAKKEPNDIINILSQYIPAMVMVILVVYCLKDAKLLSSPFGLPELAAVSITVFIKLFFNRSLTAIFGGTIVYMIILYLL